MELVCYACARRFKNYEALAQHFQSPLHHCPQCRYSFATTTILKQHLCLASLQSLTISDEQAVAHGFDPVDITQPQLNDPGFSTDPHGMSLSPIALNDHMGTGAQSGAVECPTCLRSFDDQRALDWHLAPWSMHPELHDSVDRLLKQDGLHLTFHENDETTNCLESYDTLIRGEFNCDNHTCRSKGWPSGHIAMEIRLYKGSKYNARVFHQSCVKCGHISRPELDGSYAERIAYRLKKWHGIRQEPPPFTLHGERPHLESLCEGCKHNHCKEGGNDIGT